MVFNTCKSQCAINIFLPEGLGNLQLKIIGKNIGEVWGRDGVFLGNELEQMGKRWAKNTRTLLQKRLALYRQDYGKI